MNALKWIRERHELLLRRPFWRLAAHFGERLFAGSDDSGEGSLNLGVGAMLALLATPGLFITVLLFDKYSATLRFLRGGAPFDPYAQSLPDQYFYFSFSMAITGVVTALKWDSIFPDRRDYMNLAPLPLPTRHIFLANIIAIVVIAVLFVADVNAVSSLLFPYLATMEQGTFLDFVRFLAAHALGVSLCSLFTFAGLFALVGTLMAILPNHLFRRLSLYLRVAVVVAMLALLCTSWALPRLLAGSGLSSPVLKWLPPAWFLGFARSMMGKAVPQLAPLGTLGIRVLAAIVVLAAAAYVLSYYRYFIRIPEKLDIAVRSRAPRKMIPDWLWDRLLLRTPFERACYRFAFKTLVRNERQSLLFGGIVGLGLVLASQSLVSAFSRARGGESGIPSADLLAVPLILIFFVLCALRFVFDLPAELRANWVPQVIVDREKHQALALARKIMLSLVWPAIVIIALPIYSYFWGWKTGVGHTLVLLVWSTCLADLLLRHFRKIPFTCANAPWKQNATGMIVIYALGFVLFSSITTDIEHSLLSRGPIRLWFAAPIALVIWKLFLKFTKDEFDSTELIFEEPPIAAVEFLNLTGR